MRHAHPAAPCVQDRHHVCKAMCAIPAPCVQDRHHVCNTGTMCARPVPCVQDLHHVCKTMCARACAQDNVCKTCTKCARACVQDQRYHACKTVSHPLGSPTHPAALQTQGGSCQPPQQHPPVPAAVVAAEAAEAAAAAPPPPQPVFAWAAPVPPDGRQHTQPSAACMPAAGAGPANPSPLRAAAWLSRCARLRPRGCARPP